MSDDYDNDESDDQRGGKVDSIEVKRLKERIKRKDRELDELVDKNKRLKSELRKALSSNYSHCDELPAISLSESSL